MAENEDEIVIFEGEVVANGDAEGQELAETETEPKPWDRLPDEPGVWYERFELYRSLGPGRTLEQAWRLDKERTGLNAKRPHFRWYEVKKEWRWDERAQAWDDYQNHQVRQAEIEAEKQLRLQARQNRRALLDGFTGTMSTALLSYTNSIDKLSEIIRQYEEELSRLGFTEEDEERRNFLREQITSLARSLAAVSALSDLTKAMEMTVKQLRTEFGDFIVPENERTNEERDGNWDVGPDGTLRVIVYD